MTTIQELAGKLYDAFQTKTRDNGDTFVCLKDDQPEWMTDVIRAAHDNGQMMPDDFRYALIKEAAAAIWQADSNSDIDECADEFADGVDVYTSSLCEWAASHGYRTAYCDEALDEYGKPESLSQLLHWGQPRERREVFDQLLQALADLADDGDDE